ncbi:BlaI/MecI/CopY family transcriptional regulator [Pedobacter gandavensis]|uniref:BlaI/MecI/CopY family transcriptional regulator n=1 Tax=Pedobacter gandavensis TaxID=2679963 RepID=UPI00292CD8D9|nr:BlaI/MecI/CopY family transcriptional regulator [Pedobacter gandavensis]
MEIKDLTKAEEQLMQLLWKLDKAFVKELIAELPAPKPAYNTTSTIIRILEAKGFIGYEAFGRTHRYYPLISKVDYTRHQAQKLLTDYFENSIQDMFSFFVKEKNMNLKEADEILRIIDKIKD